MLGRSSATASVMSPRRTLASNRQSACERIRFGATSRCSGLTFDGFGDEVKQRRGVDHVARHSQQRTSTCGHRLDLRSDTPPSMSGYHQPDNSAGRVTERRLAACQWVPPDARPHEALRGGHRPRGVRPRPLRRRQRDRRTVANGGTCRDGRTLSRATASGNQRSDGTRSPGPQSPPPRRLPQTRYTQRGSHRAVAPT